MLEYCDAAAGAGVTDGDELLGPGSGIVYAGKRRLVNCQQLVVVVEY